MADKDQRLEIYRRMKSDAMQAIEKSQVALQQRGIDKDKFAAVIEEAMRANPNLLECTDPRSFALAVREACLDGLAPDNRNAHIRINRNGVARYYPMKEGLLRLLQRELPGIDISSGFIREGDEYTLEEVAGQDPKLTVRKILDGEDGRRVIGSWATANLPGHTTKLFVLDREDIAKVRAMSGAKSGPWVQWEGAMAEKSAIKGLVNRLRYLLPESSALLTTLDRENLREEQYKDDDEPLSVELHDEVQGEPDPAEEDDIPVDLGEAEPKRKAKPKPEPENRGDDQPPEEPPFDTDL